MSSEWRGTLLVALSGMLYGVIGYFGTELFREHFSVSAMLFWRFFIAAVWMLPGVIWNTTTRVQSINRPTELIKNILIAAGCYSGGSAFYFMASTHIGTGLAMVIFFSFPVFVTLFAWVLSNWKMNKHAFFSLCSVLAGLFLLKNHHSNPSDVIGIYFAIIAAFFYASYVYRSQHTARTIDSRLLTMLTCFCSAIIFLIITYCTHSFIIPTTISAWLYAGILGVFATALPIQLLLDGLKYISPVKASILSVLEPVVTVIVGLALLHETISVVQLVGIMIVLSGAILIQFEKTVAVSEG